MPQRNVAPRACPVASLPRSSLADSILFRQTPAVQVESSYTGYVTATAGKERQLPCHQQSIQVLEVHMVRCVVVHRSNPIRILLC